MSTTSANNKRIAKNTLFLYFRTFIIMLISLYTSRVVLKALGETDFGIYNLYDEAAKDFVNGYEPSIWLDFNVDGVIIDHI